MSVLFVDWRPVLALMAFYAAANVYLYTPWRGAPLEIYSLEVTSEPRIGGVDLMVTAVLDKYRDCPASITRAIWYGDNTTSIALGQPSGPILHAAEVNGPTEITQRFVLPPLPAGEYTFRSTTTYDCRDWTYVVESPPARFEVP